jgi:hypothetical protein
VIICHKTHTLPLFCGAKLMIFDNMRKKSVKKALILQPKKQKKWK